MKVTSASKRRLWLEKSFKVGSQASIFKVGSQISIFKVGSQTSIFKTCCVCEFRELGSRTSNNI